MRPVTSVFVPWLLCLVCVIVRLLVLLLYRLFVGVRVRRLNYCWFAYVFAYGFVTFCMIVCLFRLLFACL